MRIRTIVCSLAALLLAAPALASPGDGAATLQKLTKPLTLQAEDARFEDIVEFVRTATGATVDIAWIGDRNSDGLDPDAIVSINVQGGQALSVLLFAASRATVDGVSEPTWQLDQDTGALQVGPRSRLNKFKRLEIYDIQDMLFVLPDYREVPQLNLNSVIRQGQGGGGGGIFQQTQDERTEFSPEEEAERIMEILRAVIEPDEWIANGGDGAMVRFYQGSLLVSAPDYIHRQINGYPFLAGPVGRPPLAKAEAEQSEEPTAPEQGTAAEAEPDAP